MAVYDKWEKKDEECGRVKAGDIQQPCDSPIEKNNNSDSIKEGIKRLFDGKNDSDKLMTAALLVLLMREGADKTLLLVLGYIFL